MHLSQTGLSSLDGLSHDALMIMVEYLNAKDMFSLESTCKGFNGFFIPEQLWKAQCMRRWRTSERAAKVVGASSWKHSYALLHKHMRLPKGSYSEVQRNTTFGSGRAGGCDCWVSIGHKSNTRASQTFLGGRRIRSIEFRVCFQNVYNGSVTLNLDGRFVQFDVLDDKSQLKEVETFNHRIIAMNGHKVARPSPVVCLKQLEYAVIAFDVCCPKDVQHETDMLLMAHKLAVYWDQCQRGNLVDAHDIPASLKRHTELSQVNNRVTQLDCKFIDEATIWEHYVELPGRSILLRRESDFNLA